ncbi:hypothetical protein [Staphylococcus simiae]|uniref:Type I secretion system protein n=1 Tax=Staphylococcus simiae CCM 7213 = CCUG 51256 TaxID=911238 RepID=G5JF59_9STAP|nr:hypothetical protein [Staphylococcus simiae]EHJ09151.1 hypothetical protein SS7213T_00254 [Staphylococcus simiae CCM 7213 = CCUG 51256]PNZ13904.1 type I secretion system protein [Staphylococcus simiae]SNV59023.1 Uncharacterised protein [Staphylococcus simiae]
MSEFIAAIIGGIMSFLATLWATKKQFSQQQRIRENDARNDIVSMIDIVIYKTAKVRNNELHFKTANFNKADTCDIVSDILRDYESLNHQVQDLIIRMSNFKDNSNAQIQEFLNYYDDLEMPYNKLKIAYRIYQQQYDNNQYDNNAIAFSKRKLDYAIGTFINNLKKFSLQHFEHQIFEPSLNPILSKDEAIRPKTNRSY